MRDGFIRVAAGTPKIRVADCRYNAEQIFTMMREADKQGVKILVLSELCLTGYTCGDLFLQETLLEGAMEGLRTILKATKHLEILTVFGMPFRAAGKLFNCAAAVQKGEVVALVPKTNLPNYGEFYEKRWFESVSAFDHPLNLSIAVPGMEPDGDGEIALYTSLAQSVIECEGIPGLKVGIEICEDLWASDPPSRRLAEAGAVIILNLSASNEVVGKAAYRRQLVVGQSGRLCCGYVYADAGEGESTTDVVFTGHNMIAENGALLAERRFASGLTISEIDVQRLLYERRRLTTFPPTCEFQEGRSGAVSHAWAEFTPCETKLTRYVSPTPFIPENEADRAGRCEEILTIAALGLKKRLEHTGAKTAVVGLSGGLDSTLALLITALAMGMLHRPASDIIAVTMPCFGTTDRTRNNAALLAERMGATLHTIPIGDTVRSHFRDIGHSMEDQDVTFENAQARERTQVLMDVANQNGGLVIGTGDLSELALGWCTYNGDHMSMYAVNASIPKTLVRHLVDYVARDNLDKDQELTDVLEDILDTPVSPELLPAVQGEISQRTEDLVGPYELHDFFLYYVLRWGFGPRKVLRLAEQALGRRYSREVLLKWLKSFYRRFFAQQFKRSCMPDGPKVGSAALSPRGDWRMPSDASARLWLEELEGL
ncbi:MAG: NAD(+) synthase [Oscillospiraceae bacterium]|nr:NAD(+) synthase [Oscillospiraceae bacterium]